MDRKRILVAPQRQHDSNDGIKGIGMAEDPTFADMMESGDGGSVSKHL